MISEGSFDTEDWSNDAEKFSFDHINKLHCTRLVPKTFKNL